MLKSPVLIVWYMVPKVRVDGPGMTDVSIKELRAFRKLTEADEVSV